MQAIEVVFGAQPMEYHVGAATVAVPGNAVGLEHVHRRWGRLPWREVVAPALVLAREGVSLSAGKAAVLVNVRAAMLLGEGAAAYAPRGRLLEAGERLVHRGLDEAFRALQEEGAAPFVHGEPARAMVDLVAGRGGLLSMADLAAYAPIEHEARRVPFTGATLHGRTDLLDVLGTLTSLPGNVGRLDAADRARALVRALLGPERHPGTSNVCAVDAAGNACAITTSLGLGSGDWVPGYGLHCNSMLGEGELMVAGVEVGERVPSMMSPFVATDAHGLALVAGAAGGSRIRSSLVQVTTGVLAEGLPPQLAVDRPRLNPVAADGGVRVHLEPGYDEQAVDALASDGMVLEQWHDRSAYFGGVTLVGRGGPAADPRRDGAVATPTP
jgi:gamma-glutamyltranspeptidase/glutathione hydrolase